ncbi:hypothetical protein [Citrobacter telavivensis]|uniref:hypothetical protein n=1 Tax=Citrobacter telavivensis TaxID=2653932 RepID=UPI00359E494A
MSMSLTTFSWMMHGNDEGLVDGDTKRRISVNWVMPTGELPVGVPSIDGQTVIDTVGSLLWPWQMRITGWAIVTDKQFHLATPVPTNVLTDPQNLQEKMADEIGQKSSRCKLPFSTAMAQAQTSPGEISLPHLFAPLTLLPAGVSLDMLGMTRSLTLDDATLPVACAPEFTMTHKGQEIVFSPVRADTKGEIVTIGYEAKVEKEDKPYSGLPAFAVVMKKIKPADSATLTPTLKSAERAETGMRAWLADAVLAPLPMLTHVLNAKTVNGEWQPGIEQHQLLNRALGPGYLRTEIRDRSIRHFWFWDRLQGGNPVAISIETWDANTQVWETLRQAINNPGTGEHRLLQPLVDDSSKSITGFALNVGMMLSTADGRRIMMTSWLAAVAVNFHQPDANNPTLNFSEWYQLISLHYSDPGMAELQARWWFFHLSKNAPAATQALRAGIESWIAGDVSTQATVLSDRYQEMLALLVECPTPDTQNASISEVLQTLQQQMQLPGAQKVISLGEERDLAVEICPPDGAYDDRDIRGYAVAMAMGKESIVPKLGCAWLTDTALKVQGAWLPDTERKGPTQRFHDTVGATVQNGRKVVAFAYSGAPLSGAVSLKDGVDCLDFGWPKDPQENSDIYTSPWRLPPLAYGFRYWVTGTAIGNGGQILQENFRSGDNPCALKAASQLNFLPGEGYLYLCRVAPGAVTVQSTEKAVDPWLMEGESRAWDQQGLAADRAQAGEHPKVADGRRPRVVVICDGKNNWNSSALTSATLTLTPPDATEQVLTKWMEADICQELLKPDLGKSATLRAQRTTLLNKLRKTDKNLPEDVVDLPRHPAVKAIGVRVKFDDGPQVDYLVTPTYLTERGFLTPATLRVEAGSASRVLPPKGTDTGTITLILKPGTIATVTLWSLVPTTFFIPGPDIRMADFATDNNDKTHPTWSEASHRGFSPVVHLFECLPDTITLFEGAGRALKEIQQALRFVPQESDTVAYLATEKGFDANGLKGFLVQRHEWHWTGYPLALPKRLDDNTQLEQWSEAFAGTSSLRETQSHILQTSRAATPADWRFGSLAEPALLCRLRMPGYHGARFFACVMRPILRYRRWLKTSAVQDLENTIVAKGTVVPARINWHDPSLRLAPPTVHTTIPLVRTVMAIEKEKLAEIRTSANGALICLNDALCRTAALTQYSGVGETFDVDLEATRYATVNEIGPNPIFHAGPGQRVDDAKKVTLFLPGSSWFTQLGEPVVPEREMNWGIEVERPFGLTYDTDSNAKVVQAAIIVRPTGHDVFAYWIMAKIRIRRMLDPHEKWTLSDQFPLSEDKQSWLLGRREEGDDRVPFDFVIEIPPGTDFLLSLHFAEGKRIEKNGDANASRRLLCSWHKGQWDGTAAMRWGVQVLDQVMAFGSEQWATVKRYSPWETTEATTGLPIKSVLPIALKNAEGCKARRLLLSDYGESHWLTFIGMPYRHLAIARESLRMAIEDKYDLAQSNREHAITLTRSSVVQASENISRDLLIEPLEPIKKTAPGEEPPRVRPGGGTFHLLLVFEPVNDVATPLANQQLGRLTGVYYPQRDPITAKTRYPQLRFHSYMADSPIKNKLPDGSIGYIYKFHYTDCLPADWTTLQAQLFPVRNADGSGEEAKVRWLPEIIGPITTAPLPVHDGHWPKPNITLKRKEGKERSIDLNVDEDRGWRCQVTREEGTDVFSALSWADDLPGGLCTVLEGDRLALVGSGGRLIATFTDWSQKKGDVQTYDDKGQPRSERWGWNWNA